MFRTSFSGLGSASSGNLISNAWSKTWLRRLEDLITLRLTRASASRHPESAIQLYKV